MQRVLSVVLSLAIMLTLIAAVPVTVSAADTPSTSLSFYSRTLALEDNLTIDYNINATLFTEVGYTDPYVVFEFNGQQTTVTSYRVKDGKYSFSFENIAPNQMKDTIKATLYATYNGTTYSAAAPDYSVAQYCYTMLGRATGSEYAEFRTLLVDLLQYGAASQIYAGYKTDDLANAELTSEQRAMGTSTTPSLGSALDAEFAVVPNPTVSWRSVSLVLDSAIVIRYKINAATSENLSAKITTDSDQEWTIDGSEFVRASEGVYNIEFSGLDAGQMRDNVYITIFDGDTAVSNTLCYSVETYVYNKQNNGDTNFVNLIIAMMRYGDSAYDYITEDAPDNSEDPDEGWSDWWTPEY